MKTVAARWILAFLLIFGVLSSREAIEAPAPPPPDTGCTVIVSTLGPIVLCR